MNLAETTYWIDQLFPGEAVTSQRITVLPGHGRHGQRYESEPVQVAEFSLYDGTTEHRPETAAATVDLGRVNCGLTGEGDTDVRVEVFSVGYSDFPIADVVAAGAAVILDEPEANSPIPGRVLKDAVTHGVEGLAGAGQEASASAFSVQHLLCVVPYVWPNGVPNVSEQAGQVDLHEGDTESPNGRLTTTTQLVPITGAEYEYYQVNGPQGLMAKLAEADADLRDYLRMSVV